MNFHDDNSLTFSASILEKFDDICVHFEEQWQANTPETIESALGDFEGEARKALLLELILLDIEYRTRFGNPATSSEYESRFPDEVEVIDMAFRGSNNTDKKSSGTIGEARHFTPPQQIDLSQSFHIRQLHARGGVGVVYLARDEKLNRDVAVKFPRKTSLNSVEQFRLQREAEITGRLEHPGIVPVLAGNDALNETSCFVMRFVQGETLKDTIRKFHADHGKSSEDVFRGLGFRQLLQRFISVCETVSYAHENGVIHRDIKPSNIMLGRFGETYLLDWGLAKIIGEEESIALDSATSQAEARNPLWLTSSDTLPGQPIGTPEYASPEQIMGKIAQHEERSDVYSLGATLYSLLTSKRPIDSDKLTDLKSANALREIRKPRDINRAIPKELEAICCKAMRFELSNRYSSSQQMANDLERYLADKPVTVLPDSIPTRLRRWSRQHPRVLVGLMASVLVAVTSLALGSYLLGRKNVELSRSNNDLILARNQQKLAQSETVAALGSLTDNAIERWLAQEEEMTREDREYLESILRQYKKFAESRPDQPAAFETKIDGYFRVTQLQRVLGNKDDAIQTGLRGLAFIDELDVELSDSMLDIQSKLQSITSVMLADTGEPDHARQMIDASIKTAKLLVEHNPHSSDYRFKYCQRLDYRGIILTQVQDYETASESFQRTLALLDEIPKPDQLDQTQLLGQKAASNHNLGWALLNLKKYSEARERLERSIEFYKALADHTSKIAYRVDHCRALSTLGTANQFLQNHAAAKNNLGESIRNLESIIDDYPALVDPYVLVGKCYYEMARVHRNLGEHAKSLELCEKSLPAIERGLVKSPNELPILAQYYKTIVLKAQESVQLNRQADAASCFLDAIGVAENLFKLDAQTNRRIIVNALLLAGEYHVRKENYVESNEFASRALKLIQDAGDPLYRKNFYRDEIGCHQLLGWGLMFSGKNSESIEHWQFIIDVTKHQPTFAGDEDMLISAQAYRAFCLASIEPAEAMASISELLKLQELSELQVYTLSCAAAVSSKQLKPDEQRIAAEKQSLELLERAAIMGYFPSLASLKKLKNNHSFSSLLDHPEFKRIEALISKLILTDRIDQTKRKLFMRIEALISKLIEKQ